jgi:hypothetical protein
MKYLHTRNRVSGLEKSLDDDCHKPGLREIRGMAPVRSPNGISIGLLQKGDALLPEVPRSSMPYVGDVLTRRHALSCARFKVSTHGDRTT